MPAVLDVALDEVGIREQRVERGHIARREQFFEGRGGNFVTVRRQKGQHVNGAGRQFFKQRRVPIRALAEAEVLPAQHGAGRTACKQSVQKVLRTRLLERLGEGKGERARRPQLLQYGAALPKSKEFPARLAACDQRKDDGQIVPLRRVQQRLVSQMNAVKSAQQQDARLRKAPLIGRKHGQHSFFSARATPFVTRAMP